MDGTASEIRHVALGRLIEGPNTRKHFDEVKLTELTEDVRAHGILSPLLARPLPPAVAAEHGVPVEGYWEIVCGARRFRAANGAHLSTVPVIVRELDDREALEAQISENDRREDVSPIEQAEGYLCLHTTHGVSVEEIAQRFGVRRAFVNERLAIARACDEVREALDAGRIRVGVALAVSRLPSHDYQREAIKHFTTANAWGPEGFTVAEAGQWIGSTFHLRLASAPFDTGDATLTAAGSCDACPKTTEAQRPLFEEELSSAPAQCMDPRCYSEKREAAWIRATVEHRNAGRHVLSASESAAIVQGLTCSKGYARADVPPVEHGQGRKTWRQLLGAHYPEPVIARAPNGDVVEVLEPEALKVAVKAAGLDASKKPKKHKALVDGEKVLPADDLAARVAEANVERAARQAVAVEVRRASEGFDAKRPAAWDFVARIVVALGDDVAVCDTLSEITGRTVTGTKVNDALSAWLPSAQPDEVVTLVALVAARTAPELETEPDIYRALREAFGVDPGAIRDAVREAAAKKSAQKLVKLPKKAPKSKPVEQRIEVERDDEDEVELDETDEVTPSDPGGVLLAKGVKLKRSMGGAASWVQVATAGNKLLTYDLEGAGPEHIKKAVEIRSADKGAKMVTGFYAAGGDELDGEQVAFWDAKAAKKGGTK